MMYGYGYSSMMLGVHAFKPLIYFVVLVDLILVGVWLWQKISKK